MWPSRALLLISALWLLLIPIYVWPIWQTKRPPTAGSVYRIWPEKRIEVREHRPALDNLARIERLHGRGLASHWMGRLLFAPFRVPNRISRVQRRLVVNAGTAAQFCAGVDRLGADGFRYPVSAERLSAGNLVADLLRAAISMIRSAAARGG